MGCAGALPSMHASAFSQAHNHSSRSCYPQPCWPSVLQTSDLPRLHGGHQYRRGLHLFPVPLA